MQVERLGIHFEKVALLVNDRLRKVLALWRLEVGRDHAAEGAPGYFVIVGGLGQEGSQQQIFLLLCRLSEPD